MSSASACVHAGPSAFAPRSSHRGYAAKPKFRPTRWRAGGWDIPFCEVSTMMHPPKARVTRAVPEWSGEYLQALASFLDQHPPLISRAAPIPAVLRPAEAAKYVGIGLSSLWERINPSSPRFDIDFPKPLKLSERCTGFQRADLDNWLVSKAASRL